MNQNPIKKLDMDQNPIKKLQAKLKEKNT